MTTVKSLNSDHLSKAAHDLYIASDRAMKAAAGPNLDHFERVSLNITTASALALARLHCALLIAD